MVLLKTVNLKRVQPTMPEQGTPTPYTVTIPVEQYAQLLRDSADLSRLRATLQPAAPETQGMSIETLNLASSYATQANIKIIADLPQTDLDGDGDLGNCDRFEMESLQSILDETNTDLTSGSDDEFRACEHVNHTVILLPAARVTHAQVAAAVRGGALLQIFCQRFSNQVNVTFARSEDAAGFLAHAQSTPFYVGSHLTTVQWAPRGYIAPEYVFKQAHAGVVSRNLVLEKVKAKITEAIIRRDLHHIHNMAVISIKFANGNAYISTSSVGGALYARTCMRSRATYKSMRISFDKDECAKPFSRVRRSRAATPVKTPKKPQDPIYNPYEVLLSQGECDFDPGEDEDEQL